MRTVKRRIVSVFIVSSDNKILLGRKRPDSGAVYEQYWHKPGGGVEINESDEDAVRREILEETGLDIGDCKIVLVDDNGADKAEKTLASGERVIADMQFNNFKVELKQSSKEIKLNDTEELINLTWFELKDLSSIDITPPMKTLLNRIGTNWLPYGSIKN